MSVSTEVLAVDWASSTDAVRDVSGASLDNGDGTYRIATRLPADPTMPWLVVRLVDGAPLSPGTKTHVQDLVQFDAYGATGAGSPDYATAETLADALIEAFEDAAGYLMSGVGRISEIVYVAKRRIEEPDTGWARFSVDALITARRETG